ncbi:Disease resistance protein (TIR-NBS-LRR class) [Quillaja saponaria]|uniref:Disease resistance protein (TIR-NBS-LRR class) n=1 Tax=Quillaja saponaria TaxID=32244 RepID=A0AAD7PP27_QUISA|nr:Disease resistance protein (TIR-NBS-LRR class) [Quillaja saponaria]
MELRRTNNLLVLPIFYGVEPSDVRNQTGSFTLALKNHKRNFSWEKILSWTRALTEAGNLNGWHITDGHEAKIINEIVNYISRRLDMTYLFVAQYPVGVEARVQAMMELLGSGSDCVRIVGILGMGGIGKTTNAKAVYNEIRRDFEGGTFLANVRENWGQHDGPGHLQQQLLTDVFLENKTQIRGLEWGIILLKERLRHRRILVVLDDVDKLEQLNALCGSRDWFCPGSRIIIAPRDENLLNVLKVDEVYLMGEMDLTESLELFSQHAFKEKRPKEDFAKLSRDVVTYSGGLPLALEVLGSYLFGRKIPQWKSTLEKLKRIPNDQVQQKLKISFEGLNDDKLKDIFLDISCFFIGMNINDVVEISNGCGFFAEIGITILMERCLITVDSKNKLRMHDLLRDMGREIVREKWPKEPEERSRLWWHEDVCDVLTKHMGTKSIEGLTLKLSRLNKENFRTEAFKKIKRLRLLQFHHVQLTGEYEYISKDLRWLCWHGFPLRSIPTDLYQQRLVSMDLRYSNLKLLWKHPVLLEGLKILNLSHCHFLTQTPDFLELPNLEKLILKDCPNLSAVHESIGCLNGLVLVNLRDCKCLGNLPRSIYKLKAVKTLILSGCSKIDRLEEDLEQMESLTTLIADNTGIKQMPFSIVKLKSILEYICMWASRIIM